MATTKITTPELFNFSDLNTALQLPSGDNASRPSAPSNGEWRFNTEEKYVEYYDSSTTAWYQIDTEATCTTNTVDYPTTNTAYYKLDSTALDQTTNNLDGTSTDITYYNGQQYSQGAVFNGSSSYINIPSAIYSSITGPFTLSAWVKTTSSGSYKIIIGMGGVNGVAAKGLSMWMDSSGVLYASWGNGSTENYWNVSATTSINTGDWFHVAITVDGLTNPVVKGYVNGVAEGSGSTGTASITFDTSFTIGARDMGGTVANYWDGSIDQVRIFSSELSATQVTDLYNEVQCPCTTNNNDNPTTNAVYYKFDGNANDSTSGAKNGTWGGTEAYAYGPYGIAADFNGTSSLITVASSLPWSSSFSLSMWLRPDSGLSGSGYYLPFFQKDYDSGVGGVGIAFYLNGYVLHPWIGDVGGGSNYYNIFNTGTLTADTWNHVVLTRTYNVQWELFLNGASLGTYTTNGLTQDFSGTEYYFGANGYAIGVGGTPYYYPGEIDQVRIFSSALSASQVTSLYDEVYCNTVSKLDILDNSSCLALYEFEDNANSTDSSSYNGTWSGTEAYGGGQYKKAGIFNATSSKITVPAILSSSYTGSVSFSAWFNMSNSSSNIYAIIASDDTVPVSGKVILLSIFGGVLELTAYNFATVVGTGTTNVADGEWHNVIVVFDNSAGTFNLYLDGNSTAEISFSASLGTNLTLDKVFAEDWNIGGQDTIRYFDGSIDQVRIFNKALSETERLQVYTE